MKHDFVLIFELPDKTQDARVHYDALERECRDGRACNGVRGYLGMEFCREAKSMHHAKSTAARDVLSAIPGATLFTCE